MARLEVWFRPKVVRLESLLDAEDVQVVSRLRTKGHELHWGLETRGDVNCNAMAGSPSPNGTRQDGRSIFMDLREEIILLHRPPGKANKA